MSQKEKILERLNSLGVDAKRSLGQNFLIDSNIIDKILNEVKSIDNQLTIEVGPGLGSLTDGLKPEGLTLIELDTAFAKMWREKGYDVLESDALKLDWKDLNLAETTLVSNLPYQISSRLVVHLSLLGGPASMVLMFQKEVAQRILSPESNKNYGYLSVIAQSFWRIRGLCQVSAQCFYPRPNVESSVLVFTKKENTPEQANAFSALVKAGFAQRRKKLISNLKKHDSNYDWLSSLKEIGKDENVRAEALSIENFQSLHRSYLSSSSQSY